MGKNSTPLGSANRVGHQKIVPIHRQPWSATDLPSSRHPATVAASKALMRHFLPANRDSTIAPRRNAVAPRRNAVAPHCNAVAPHRNAVAPHCNAIAPHCNAIAVHRRETFARKEIALQRSYQKRRLVALNGSPGGTACCRPILIRDRGTWSLPDGIADATDPRGTRIRNSSLPLMK